jgi:bleomycin hydrolase
MKCMKANSATIFCLLLLIPALSFAQQNGAINEELLKRLQETVSIDASTTALMNAITKNDVKNLALSHEESINTDHHFTHIIKTQGITNQQKSGRCWLFAGLNILRPVASQNLNKQSFEFSQTYLFFYDKLEKSNLFLESIIATVSKPVEDRQVEWLFKHPIMDGGQWNMVLSLVEKYGVVPAEVVPETQSSANTGRLNSMLSKLLVKQASMLRSSHESGASERGLRREKEEMLAQVYRMLVLHMGVPPASFAWRQKDDKGNAGAPKIYTPKEFYKEFVNIDLNDYVCLHSIPLHDYDKAYQVEFDRNLVDAPNMTFVNVTIDQMKAYTLKSVLGNDPVWFGCDVGKESNSKTGVMKRGLYNYAAIYGVDFELSKADRIRYHRSVPSHAMVFTGVDIIDGKPAKWRVENSWGAKVGENGMFVMYDSWFDEYMFSAIIHKKYLPKQVVNLAQSPDTETLPPWDPLFMNEPR